MTRGGSLRRARHLALGLALAAALAAPLAAGSIPMVISDDAESRAISVVVRAGVTATRELPTDALRGARQRMNAGERLSDEDLRALAERWDGMAAKRYADRLAKQGRAKHASDLAYFYGIAAATGRAYALPDMIEAMGHLDAATEPAARMKHLISVLYPYAWAGNSAALDAVVEFNGEGKLFGALSEATRQRILDQAKSGNGRIELRLALDILSDDAAAPTDLARAREYLERAQGSKLLAVKTTAQNLLAYLDDKTAGRAAVKN
ncbi:hypothetical protein [Oceaniglobus roseus]|uniref:hypothetical protein n=1 Tax=Oceaniglobus roseus TaxID=1737570 RepID=UPI000C7ED43C|nr:hypothetical protein [Kandeliimicrobium roseum]